MVPQKYKATRLAWARWVKRQPGTHLRRWAYTDGTVFYLGRTAQEAEQATRGSLGPMVWRRTDGSDALYEDCVGPSAYWKAQGTPVRVWGLLANGKLHVTILPANECMNRWWYEWIVRERFPKWIKDSFGVQKRGVNLVQDHEKCLWAGEPRMAMGSIRINLLENYPKCSQDLNPIEEAWRELRQRLYDTQPTDMEGRRGFIVRLRSAVSWLNKNRADFFSRICNSQVDWAEDVRKAKGARTRH